MWTDRKGGKTNMETDGEVTDRRLDIVCPLRSL